MKRLLTFLTVSVLIICLFIPAISAAQTSEFGSLGATPDEATVALDDSPETENTSVLSRKVTEIVVLKLPDKEFSDSFDEEAYLEAYNTQNDDNGEKLLDYIANHCIALNMKGAEIEFHFDNGTTYKYAFTSTGELLGFDINNEFGQWFTDLDYGKPYVNYFNETLGFWVIDMGNYEAYIYTVDEDNNEIGTIMKVSTTENPEDDDNTQETSENNNPEATENNTNQSENGNSSINKATMDQSKISTNKGTSTNNQAIQTGSDYASVSLISFVAIISLIIFIYTKKKQSD